MKGPIAPTLRSGSLPLLVLLMTLLAGLALSGQAGVQALARTWIGTAAHAATIEIPTDTADSAHRIDTLLTALRSTPGITHAHLLPEGQVRALLAPWLGTLSTDRPSSLRVPAVITVQHTTAVSLPQLVTTILPEAVVEEDLRWSQRLQSLGTSLIGCAWLAVSLIGGIAILTIGITVRRSISAQRRAIEIIHAIGATDRQIAGRIARRAALLALVGSLFGLVCLIPVLTAMAQSLAPFQTHTISRIPAHAALLSLPHDLLRTLTALPVIATILSWLTAQCVVRVWLQRLP